MAAEVDASVGIVVDATSYYAGRTTSAVCCSMLQYAAVCCIVMHCDAVCCIVLQCVVVCCSELIFDYFLTDSSSDGQMLTVLSCVMYVMFYTLQCTAIHCNTLKHTATH